MMTTAIANNYERGGRGFGFVWVKDVLGEGSAQHLGVQATNQDALAVVRRSGLFLLSGPVRCLVCGVGRFGNRIVCYWGWSCAAGVSFFFSIRVSLWRLFDDVDDGDDDDVRVVP